MGPWVKVSMLCRQGQLLKFFHVPRGAAPANAGTVAAPTLPPGVARSALLCQRSLTCNKVDRHAGPCMVHTGSFKRKSEPAGGARKKRRAAAKRKFEVELSDDTGTLMCTVVASTPFFVRALIYPHLGQVQSESC